MLVLVLVLVLLLVLVLVLVLLQMLTRDDQSTVLLGFSTPSLSFSSLSDEGEASGLRLG